MMADFFRLRRADHAGPPAGPSWTLAGKCPVLQHAAGLAVPW